MSHACADVSRRYRIFFLDLCINCNARRRKLKDMATVLQATAAANGEKADDEPVGTIPDQKEHEEYQYLNLIRDILDYGEHRPDRCVLILRHTILALT